MDVSTWLALPDVAGTIGENKFTLVAEQLDGGKCALKSGPLEVFVKAGNDWIRATGHITLTVQGSERWLYQPHNYTRLPKSYETLKPFNVSTLGSTIITKPPEKPAVTKTPATSTSKPSTKPSRTGSPRRRRGR